MLALLLVAPLARDFVAIAYMAASLAALALTIWLSTLFSSCCGYSSDCSGAVSYALVAWGGG